MAQLGKAMIAMTPPATAVVRVACRTSARKAARSRLASRSSPAMEWLSTRSAPGLRRDPSPAQGKTPAVDACPVSRTRIWVLGVLVAIVAAALVARASAAGLDYLAPSCVTTRLRRPRPVDRRAEQGRPARLLRESAADGQLLPAGAHAARDRREPRRRRRPGRLPLGRLHLRACRRPAGRVPRRRDDPRRPARGRCGRCWPPPAWSTRSPTRPPTGDIPRRCSEPCWRSGR